MELYYQDTKTGVKFDKSVFPTKAGCRQGAQEAPMFFNCYSDWVNYIANYLIQQEIGDAFGVEVTYQIPANCSMIRNDEVAYNSPNVTILPEKFDDISYHYRKKRHVETGSEENLKEYLANFYQNQAAAEAELTKFLPDAEGEDSAEFLSVRSDEIYDSLQDLHVKRTFQPVKSNLRLKSLYYADDTVLFFKNTEAVSQGLQTLDKIFDNYGLKLNYDKTETMVINGSLDETLQDSLLEINGQKIKNTSKVKYLGVELDAVKKIETGQLVNYQRNLDRAERQFQKMEKILQNGYIQPEIRSKFLMSFIRSLLCLSCASWDLSDEKMAEFEKFWYPKLELVLNASGLMESDNGSISCDAAEAADVTDAENDDEDWDAEFQDQMMEDEKIYKSTKEEILNQANLYQSKKSSTLFKDLEYYIFKLHFTWIGKLVRRPNENPQKQLLFGGKDRERVWEKIEEITGFRKFEMMELMMDDREFMKYLEKDLCDCFPR